MFVATPVMACDATPEKGARLINTTPLAFELVCKDGVVATVGDAVGVFGELTPEREE